MQETTTLTLKERTALGSRASKKMRANGEVPAVVYGHKQASKALVGSYLEVAKAYQQVGKHSPIELEIDGKKKLAMVKQAAVEPVKHRLLHIAFYVVKQNEKVQTEVSVRLVGEGESDAEKAGLVLIKNIDAVQIEALPRALPEAIELDVTKLAAAGDSLTVADLTIPEGVTVLSDPAQQILSAVEPAALAAANDAAGGPEPEEEAEEGDETAEAAEGEGAESSEETAAEAAKKE